MNKKPKWLGNPKTVHDEPLVSVIIPTRNSDRTLLKCLESIKNQTYERKEIIVVDNMSSDKTVETAKKFCRVFSYGPERSAQRNFGSKNARGEYLLFLDSDMELTPNVIKECVREVMSNQGNAIIIPETSVGEGFWTKCRSLERSCYIGDETIEAPRFFEKDAFMKVGGFDEKMTGPEDWDLQLRIKKKGYGVSRIGAFIIHHEGKVNLANLMLKKYYYGKTISEYIKKHPETAYRQLTVFRPAFFRNRNRLLKDPVHALGLAVMKFCELSIGAVGLVRSRMRSG